jgi:mannose-6-phosphate isomerase-like protein (cupin superfamily)
MQTISLNEISGEKFPSGRHTRIFVGPESLLSAKHFVSGFVVIDPGGKVPEHEHEQEEVYYILQGRGEMTVGSQSEILEAVSAVYIPPGQMHALKNNGEDELHMLFVYAPAVIVSHWEEERAGRLK